ncbi:MAG TPA: hypothetical protein PK733_10260 [Clostridiales bacterium]|nr:hypothetical protein [Clostridiales bacterium]
MAANPVYHPDLCNRNNICAHSTVRLSDAGGALSYFVLIGALLLIWAAKRAHSHWKSITWGLVTMVALLVGGQAIAVISGLTSGAIEPAGWIWALVITSIALYSLTLIVIGIAGVLLVREL